MAKAKQWFVIINPTSGNGSAAKKWDKINRLLKQAKFIFNYQFTEHPKHSIELVQYAVNQGFKDIIVIGGDGTIHNVLNAIQTQNFCEPNSINVGIIPVGTGNDWIKSYKISKNPKKAIQTILKENVTTQDVGVIEFLKTNKNPVYFNNLAGIGFDGYVVSKVAKFKNLGSVAYLIAAIIGLFSYKNFEVSISVNSRLISSKILLLVIGLCKYSGGGMQLTKNPNSADGYFDVSIAKDFSKFDIIKNIFNLFNGKIVNVSKVETLKCETLEVDVKDEYKPLIEADGELIGEGSFKVSIIKNAFTFYA
jgi:YegS/Rv2252/BmrU family lipid kinase